MLCGLGTAACSARTATTQLRAPTTPPRTLQQTRSPRAVASTQQRRQRSQADVESSLTRGPWRVYLAQQPRRETTRNDGSEPDGTNYVVMGGSRARIREANISWSRDVVLGGIIGSARTARGWLFASTDGALYRAPYFTGPLEFVSSLADSGLVRTLSSHGRILALNQQQRLYMGDDLGWTGWSAPSSGSFITGSFLNNSVGVTIFSPGRAMATHDGGAHWSVLDLHEQSPLEMIGITDSLVLRTMTQSYRLSADGQLSPFNGMAVSVENVIPDVENVRISAAFEGPAARATALMRDGFALDSGRIYTSLITRPVSERFGTLHRNANSSDTLHVFGPQGTPATSTTPTRLEGPSSDCKYVPFGQRLLAVCRSTGYQQPQVHALGPTGTWSPMDVPPGAYYTIDLAASMDGERFWTFNTTCDPRQRISTGVTWCHSRLGEPWAPFTVERLSDFVASYGNYVVYRSHSGPLDRNAPGPLRVQLIDSGPENAQAPQRTDNRARLVTGQFTRDGTFFARGTIGDDTVLAVGTLDRALVIQALPAGVVDVGMVDRSRGLAVGKHLHELWSTQDGGDSWQPIRHVTHGDAAGISIDSAGGDPAARLQCRWWGCVVPDKLLWAPETLIGEPPVEAFATPTPTGELEVVRAFAPPTSLDLGVQRCAPTADVEPDERYRLGHGGWLKSQPGNRFEWGGNDSRGAFRTAITQGLPPQTPTPSWRIGSSLLLPRWVSRDQAIVERCAYNTGARYAQSEYHCDLLSFERHPERVRLWLSPRTQPGLSEPSAAPRVAEMVALPGGDFAIRIATGPLDEVSGESPSLVLTRRFDQQPRLDWVLRITAAGSIVSQQSFLWAREETRVRMLAWDGHALGVAVVTAANPLNRTLRFYRSPTENGTDLGPIPIRTHPCGTESAANSPWAVSSANDGNVAIRAGRELSGTQLFHGIDGVQATLEFSASGTCLRRISAGQGALSLQRNDNAFNRLGGALTLEAAGGGFRTSYATPVRGLAITCVADPAIR